MTLLLFSSYFSMLLSSIPGPVTTIIKSQGSVFGLSFAFDDNLVIGSYYNKSNKNLNLFECYNLDCSSHKFTTIEGSADSKEKRSIVAVAPDHTVYVGFRYSLKKGLQLAIISPDRTNMTMRTLDQDSSLFSYEIDMLLFQNKNPLFVYSVQTEGTKYLLCLNPPYCTDNKIKFLTYNKNYKIRYIRATLDLSGYLNICGHGVVGTQYIRCYDVDCNTKTIKFLSYSSADHFLCKNVNVNPETNLARLLLVSFSSRKLMLFACKDVRCNTYNITSFGETFLAAIRYDKNSIPHIVNANYSQKKLISIDCFDFTCSKGAFNTSVLSNNTSVSSIELNLDATDKKVILYGETNTNNLYYYRYLDTPFPTQSPKSLKASKGRLGASFYIPLGIIVSILLGVLTYDMLRKEKSKKAIKNLESNALDG